MSRHCGWSTAALVWAGVLVALACGCSAEAKKSRALGRGDRYFEQKKYREAALEYRNVLAQDPKNAHAQRGVGLALFEMADLGQAFPYLLGTVELDPQDLEVRARLASIYALARRPDKAREHALFVLSKDTRNVDALTVLAEVAETPEELDKALERLDQAFPGGAVPPKASVLKGMLLIKKGDVPAAERAFREAVEAGPQSVEAHTALGTLHLGKGEAAAAEAEFKAAADLSPPASAGRMRLADFYLNQNRPEEAKAVLRQMTDKAPDYFPAWLRQAEIGLVQDKIDEADGALDSVLKENPSQDDALLLRAQVQLRRGRTDQAIQTLQQVLKLNARHPGAQYQLALAHLAAGNVQQAKATLRGAVDTSPGFTEARLKLAELNLQTGAVQAAIEDLERGVALQPKDPRLYEMLGGAYLRNREPARALETYRKYVTAAPGDPRGPYLVGRALRAQGQVAEARKAFQQVLSTGGSVDALVQLVSMALAENNVDEALAIAKAQAERAPNSSRVQHVLGTVYERQGQLAQAEAAFKRAVELEPDLVVAYVALAGVSTRLQNPDQALQTLQNGLRHNPKEPTLLMLAGVAYEARGDVDKAKEHFQKALEVNPRFAAAANNLAWIYTEYGGDQDEALRLASMAKEVDPNDPQVSDTLGWVFYKRGVYQRAVSLLQEAAGKLPANALVHYHLGMALYKTDDRPAAKRALGRALSLDSSFRGAEEARRVLAEL